MKNPSWWQSTTIYQVYPRSFYDSNGDGIGDIQGLIQQLDYLKELGIECIWCSPFFSSPQRDFGYDISDYQGISAEYGTLSDVEVLIEQVHIREMRIIFDLVLNHTSNKHPWFLESSSSAKSDKADWYIWTNKPNNWRSMTGGSAWQYAEQRKAYYLCSFLDFQPDLNYRNKELKQEMFSVVNYWLGKGVDGFRLDIFNVIYKDAFLRNNPFSFQLFPSEENPYGFFQEAKYNLNQKETVALAKELRTLCQAFGERILLGEVLGSIPTIKQFLGETKNDGLTLVFNFEMLRFKFTANYFRNLIEKTEANFPFPYTPVYVFSNHDRRRSATRLRGNQEKIKLLQSLQVLLRGVPCFYNGEEIGMVDKPLAYKPALDPIPGKHPFVKRWMTELVDETINRDDVRTPMQWSPETNAGFSKASATWLPVHHNFKERNVQAQRATEKSIWNHLKDLLFFRSSHQSISHGSLSLVAVGLSNVLTFYRIYEEEKYLVLLNFTSREVMLPAELLQFKIVLRSSAFNTVKLTSWECMVLEVSS